MLHGGIRIGEYTLVEKLGSGGFGDVWKAEKRTALDVNWFALKFFNPKEDGIEFDKVGRELDVWKQLRGLRHIISVIELDRFDDYVYVVSDFADGGSLIDKARGSPSASRIERTPHPGDPLPLVAPLRALFDVAFGDGHPGILTKPGRGPFATSPWIISATPRQPGERVRPRRSLRNCEPPQFRRRRNQIKPGV